MSDYIKLPHEKKTEEEFIRNRNIDSDRRIIFLFLKCFNPGIENDQKAVHLSCNLFWSSTIIYLKYLGPGLIHSQLLSTQVSLSAQCNL